jgi:hypothetical protein
MTWRLLRIWHVEAIESVTHHPNAAMFSRTSYCLAPNRWEDFEPSELLRRVEFLLEAHYRRRNYQTAQTGDPVGMLWIAYAFEWVARSEMPANTSDNVDEDIWVTSRPVDEELVMRAITQIEAKWRQPRPGIDSRPWSDGFGLFGIEADGETWKLLRSRDPEVFDLFDRHLTNR